MLRKCAWLIVVPIALAAFSIDTAADDTRAAPPDARAQLAGLTKQDLVPAYNELLKGNYFHALQLLNKVLEKYPDNPTVLNQRARVYMVMGDFHNALVDENKAVEGQPKFYGWRQARGYLYLNRGDFDLAFEDFSEAVKLNPADELSISHQGECRRWQGRSSEALKFYERAAKLAPHDNEARVYVGSAHYHVGDYDQLKKIGEKLVYDFPSGQAGHMFIGLYLRNKGENAKAIDEFTKELKALPSSSDALVARADCYVHTGDLAAAREDMQSALEWEGDALADKFWPGWGNYRLAEIYAVRSTTYSKDDADKSEADMHRAFKYLKRAMNMGFHGFDLMKHDHDLDAIREDGRWEGVAKLRKDIQAAK